MKIKILVLIVAFLYSCTPIQSQKKVEQSEEFLLRAIEFHGHLGPFLVLGLKAGLFANQIFGRDPMKIEAYIQTKITPPQSCFADGVQFSTGCTLGKRNISLTEGESLLVTFKKNNQKLTLELKKEITEEINYLPDKEEAWENLAKDLYQREIKEIIKVSKSGYTILHILINKYN
jgi:formylmethanofuran dehydrogenase subunit E